MLRRLKVRSKLLVMLAPPLVAAVVFAALYLASRRRAGDDIIVGGVATLATLWMALTLAILVGRNIVRPVQRLTGAAYGVARIQLPGLLASVQQTDCPAGDLDLVLRESDDEIGDLAEAFNSIQTAAIDVAERQSALLRQGVSDLFVNLARRNQSLIERQLACLDTLQADEEDAVRLEALFRLDHLSIRMRRHAENLLVLAGVEQTRRGHRDVLLSSVLRAAYAEVEHMARIDLAWVSEVGVSASGAADVAHILSELLENATSFSPPSTRVELASYRAGDEYVVTVMDRGVGMSEDRLAEANSTLSRSPEPGLALSRSLGFVVVSRLAARYGIRVSLATSPFGGIVASVVLPASVLRAEAAVGPEPGQAPAEQAVSVEHDMDSQLAALVSATPPGAGPPMRSQPPEGRTGGGLARRAAQRPGAQAEGTPSGATPAPSAPPRNASAPTAPGVLARRLPASKAPRPARSDAAPVGGPATSAEDKRILLDGYWGGLQRGRDAEVRTTEDGHNGT